MLFRLLVVLALTSSVASRPQTPSPQLPPGVTVRNVKMQTFTSVSSAGSIPTAPDTKPNRLPIPVDGSAVKIERRELQAYSMEVSNAGSKAIKAFAWDFIFTEPATNIEQLRHSFANVQMIEAGQKRTARFNTALSPPKVVDAATLGKEPKTLFRESPKLRGVL